MKRLELFFAFILVPLDAAMILVSFGLAYYFRAHIETAPFISNFGFHDYLRYALYLLPFWLLLMAYNGLYPVRAKLSTRQEFLRVFVASSTAILGLVVLIFLSKLYFYSRYILILTWGISIICIFFARLILRGIRQLTYILGFGQRNILIIGDNGTVKLAADELKKEGPEINIIGVIGLNPEKAAHELRNLGSFDQLEQIIKKYKIDEVILTETKLSVTKMVNLVRICADQKIEFKYIPDVLAMMTSSFAPALIGTLPAMELKPIPLDGWGRIIKRVADIIFSAFCLIILSPILLIVAFLIKLTSRGPVIYKHQRIGRDERVFDFYKFRSMYADKCDYKGGVNWTTESDEKTKVTPFGRFIRKTNLDELPQLWNILKGDMSFVGPRPEMPKLVAKFENEMPEYFRRHKVKSGLTGWAAVNGFKGDTSIEERIKYDIYYIENWSIWFDVKIILKTVGLIFYEVFHGKTEYSARPRVDN